MGFPPGLFPTQVGLHDGWWSIGPMKNIHQSCLLLSKNPKDIYPTPTQKQSDFPRFIIIESLQDVKLDQPSPFLIEKIISSRSSPKTVKKLQTENLLVEVESKKHAESILKMEKIHNLKCCAYPHAKSNTSNGVVRSNELSLATLEEIEMTFKKQGIKEYRRVTICRNDETIQTHTYILTFEKPSIPKEIRTGYPIERVEQ